MAYGLSCFTAYGIFLDQGSNLCLLHWLVDSLPTESLGMPYVLIFQSLFGPQSQTVHFRCRFHPHGPALPGHLSNTGPFLHKCSCKCGRLVTALEKAMAPHSSTLAWKIPWMEEPGGLQSMGSLGIGHD